MDNATNVVEYFKQELDALSSKEKDAILIEVDGIISDAVKEYQESAKRDADYAYQKKINEANSEQSKKMAQLNAAKNIKINEKRQELANRVFEEAKEKLEMYVKSEEYKKNLLSSLKTLKDKVDLKDAVLYVNENDKKSEKEIRVVIGDDCIVEVKTQIGGFILENKKAGIVVDESYDSLLEDQRDWFYQNSGLIIK